MKFTEFGFEASLMEGLDAMQFENATPIQEQAIPTILEGNDLIACAQTGTGKTAAFLLPILNLLTKNSTEKLSTLILVPTRELAIQIDQQIQGLSYFLPVTSLAVYGGNDAELWGQQKNAIIEGANIIVATPGRLMQHISMGYTKFDTLEYLILDEADRMLDMGFIDDIMEIVKALPKKRQTLLFSATMPPKIRSFSKRILKPNPSEINIAISKPAEGVLQAAYLVYDSQKNNLISALLKGKDLKSVVIFSSTRLKVREIHAALKREGFVAEAIHSDLSQDERERVMLDFKNRKVEILVATDIIARGIDVDGIDLVINYDVPNDAEDYVHRIGRTARAKSTGVALTFINDKEQVKFHEIEKLIETDVYKSPLPEGFDVGPEYNPKAVTSHRRRGNPRNFRPRGGNQRNFRRNRKQ